MKINVNLNITYTLLKTGTFVKIEKLIQKLEQNFRFKKLMYVLNFLCRHFLITVFCEEIIFKQTVNSSSHYIFKATHLDHLLVQPLATLAN